MNSIDKLCVKYHGREVGSLSLTLDNKLCAFEYNRDWLLDGFSVSPLELPLKNGLYVAKPNPFWGNFGVFEDSLPDGYGRYLLHKMLLQEGIDDRNLSSIDRLSIVGESGMGALTYEPKTNIVKDVMIHDFDILQEKALEVLSEKNVEDVDLLLFNSRNSGGCRPKVVFSDAEGHWLVKFRHTYDPQDMGIQEYHYNEIARKCGINIPDVKLINGKYFASRRFDIEGDERQHVVTAGGLLCVSLTNPILDYGNLLALTGYLTQDKSYVEEMYRRMVFNYLTGNKDDHCKNFSFLIKKDSNKKWKWHLSPAYDLTRCVEGYNGEHATSINGTGHPTLNDMIVVGVKNKLSDKRCKEIIEQVRSNCKDITCLNLQ